MSTFVEIFDSTAKFLHERGISPEVAQGKKALLADVERFRKQTGVSLPESFSSFFTDFSDGFVLNWEKTEDEWGTFSMPSLDQLSSERLDWERNIRSFLDDPNSLDKCIDAPFRAKAFEIWRRMESWVPFWDEGNGDHFCVDVATGQIVYDQHDWFDGFGLLAKTNGIIAGQTLSDFLENWSRFCFQSNKQLWWGEFAQFGEIKWESDYFDSNYFRSDC